MTYYTGYNDHDEQQAWAYEQQDALEAELDYWDSTMPGWEHDEQDRERRNLVDYRDVEYPDERVIRPVMDWLLIPGAHGDGIG